MEGPFVPKDPRADPNVIRSRAWVVQSQLASQTLSFLFLLERAGFFGSEPAPNFLPPKTEGDLRRPGFGGGRTYEASPDPHTGTLFNPPTFPFFFKFLTSKSHRR